MQPLCQYPINEAAITPHIGRPVSAVLVDGDVCHGVIDRVDGGNVYMRPIDGFAEVAGVAGVSQFTRKIRSHPVVKKARIQGLSQTHRVKNPSNLRKRVHTNLFFPWLIFPLFALAALFTFPFFI